MVSSVRKATWDLLEGHLLGRRTPAMCQCLSYLGEGDGSGQSLCLKLELEDILQR